MQIIVSLLVALSVVTGIAASAKPFDAKSFYAQLDRQAHYCKASDCSGNSQHCWPAEH
jgi:hypothetical protein